MDQARSPGQGVRATTGSRRLRVRRRAVAVAGALVVLVPLAVYLLARAVSALGLWLLLVPVVVLAVPVVRRARAVVTPRRAAESARRTAEILAGLPLGMTVLPLPGVVGAGRDAHVVVGPAGVFTVETRSWRGRVDVRGLDLLVNGHRRTEVVERARHLAERVRVQLGSDPVAVRVPPLPVLVVDGASLPLLASSVDGVRLTLHAGLAEALAGRHLLTDEEVARVSAALAAAL